MNFVLEMSTSQIEAFLDYYQTDMIDTPKPTIKSLIKVEGVTITVYPSNKVMFQGKDAEFWATFWQDTYHLTINNLHKKNDGFSSDFYLSSIGSDESGVGDYFGPLTVCSVYIDSKDIDYLKPLKIRDSKLMTDKSILELAPKLINNLTHSSLVLSNEKYNALIEEGFNAHKLKAYLHAQSHIHLLKKIGKHPKIIIDQFCPKPLYQSYLKTFKEAPMPDLFIPKAESYYASVAASSIIARYKYITEMDVLSKKIGFTLSKGASHTVDLQASMIIKNFGEETLKQYAKIHFKTTLKAKDLL